MQKQSTLRKILHFVYSLIFFNYYCTSREDEEMISCVKILRFNVPSLGPRIFVWSTIFFMSKNIKGRVIIFTKIMKFDKGFWAYVKSD
jgi:hypothetical protein